ncbi:efflux RND transporter periplasmic adaptor subunit [Prolixibacteraceae bacterium JC049]|nr:efflux RND transporter periplasmic adaptor subunit [Prolixibacteraceae bacterium JC049]
MILQNIQKLAVITLLMGAVACSGEKATTTNNAAINVKVADVSEQWVDNQLELPAQIEASTSSKLSTRVMGQVKSIKVDIGDKVKKGDLLMTIRSADLMAQKAQVEANSVEVESALKNALKNQTRLQNLLAKESASQKEVDDINMHVEMLKAKKSAIAEMRKQVEEQLKYAYIRAPFNGTVSARFVNVGDMANPGMPLLGFETSEKFEVVARIPEFQVEKAQVGDTVSMSRDGKMVGKAIITQINRSGSYTGPQYLIKAQPIVKGDWYSGMFVRLELNTDKVQKILVAKDMLVEKGQLKAIWVVSKDKKAMLRYVRTGKAYGDKVEILSGLSNNERCILPGNYRLSNNVTVNW